MSRRLIMLAATMSMAGLAASAGDGVALKSVARIGVRFDGKAITNCAEYCVSEGWIKALVSDGRGNWVKERGKPRTIRKPGKVEPYWKG